MSEISAFLDYLKIEKAAAKNTIEAYTRDLSKYENWVLRNSIELSNITAEELARYGLELISTGLKPASIDRNFSAIRALHNFLAREFSQQNPTDSLPEIKQSKRLPKALSVAEVQSIIEKVQNPLNPMALRDQLILELLYGTGGRVSEIVGITMPDISSVIIDGNEVATIKLKGKGGKERIVPIGSFAKKALDDYLVRTRPLLSKNPKVTSLFLNARGTKLSRQSAWAVVKDAAKRAKIDSKVTPHVFRHSYATHLLDGGADIRVVQELLGHSSVTTTQIYTLITIDKLRESYRLAHPRAK